MIDDNSTGLTTAPATLQAFAQSQVRDEQGRLIRLFHGTRPGNDIHHFRLPGKSDGIYFTPDPDYAESFTLDLFGEHEDGQGPVYPVYANIKNPYVVKTTDGSDEFYAFVYRSLDRADLMAKGYDGAMLYVDGFGLDQVIAFDPDQIGWAIGSDIPLLPRPMLDSEISPGFVDDPAFSDWFEGSTVVDSAGLPRTLYHGTLADFEHFSLDFIGDGNGLADWGEGLYFADNPEAANTYAEGEGGNVRPVYVAMRNPATNEVLLSDEFQSVMDDDMGFVEVSDYLKEQGYDGICFTHPDGSNEYVVFNPGQIRCALDPTDRYSQQRIEQSVIAEHRQWFEGSVVVNDQGDPMPVYHGTINDFDRFEEDSFTVRAGFYFSQGPDFASSFAIEKADGIDFDEEEVSAGPLVMPVFLSIKNPLDVRDGWPVFIAEQLDHLLVPEWIHTFEPSDFWNVMDDADGHNVMYALKQMGYDGLLAMENGERVYVAFDPDQIRNAMAPGAARALNRPVPHTLRPYRPLLRDDEGKPLTLYHGTPNGPFSAFDTTPAFLTDRYHAAQAYALGQNAREEGAGEATVVLAHMRAGKTKTYTAQELGEILPDDEGGIEWASFDNLAYDLEKEGYDSVIIRGAVDYLGTEHVEGQGKASVRVRYDQYVALDADIIEITANAPVAHAPDLSLKAFHGSDELFTEFDTRAVHEIDRRRLGSHFSSSKDYAKAYGKHCYEVRLMIDAPLDLRNTTATEAAAMLPITDFDRAAINSAFKGSDYTQYGLIESINPIALRHALEQAGYDGLIYEEAGHSAYIVFDPKSVYIEQIHEQASSAMFQSDRMRSGPDDELIFEPLLDSQEKSVIDWMDDTVLRTEQGSPLRVLHGSPADFEKFRDNSEGIFFARGVRTAAFYAETDKHEMGTIHEAYIKMRQPLVMTWREWVGGMMDNGFTDFINGNEALMDLGYDGVILTEPDLDDPAMSSESYMVFSSDQILSAPHKVSDLSLDHLDLSEPEDLLSDPKSGMTSAQLVEVVEERMPQLAQLVKTRLARSYLDRNRAMIWVQGSEPDDVYEALEVRSGKAYTQGVKELVLDDGTLAGLYETWGDVTYLLGGQLDNYSAVTFAFHDLFTHSAWQEAQASAYDLYQGRNNLKNTAEKTLLDQVEQHLSADNLEPHPDTVLAYMLDALIDKAQAAGAVRMNIRTKAMITAELGHKAGRIFELVMTTVRHKLNSLEAHSSALPLNELANLALASSVSITKNHMLSHPHQHTRETDITDSVIEAVLPEIEQINSGLSSENADPVRSNIMSEKSPAFVPWTLAKHPDYQATFDQALKKRWSHKQRLLQDLQRWEYQPENIDFSLNQLLSHWLDHGSGLGSLRFQIRKSSKGPIILDALITELQGRFEDRKFLKIAAQNSFERDPVIDPSLLKGKTFEYMNCLLAAYPRVAMGYKNLLKDWAIEARKPENTQKALMALMMSYLNTNGATPPYIAPSTPHIEPEQGTPEYFEFSKNFHLATGAHIHNYIHALEPLEKGKNKSFLRMAKQLLGKSVLSSGCIITKMRYGYTDNTWIFDVLDKGGAFKERSVLKSFTGQDGFETNARVLNTFLMRGYMDYKRIGTYFSARDVAPYHIDAIAEREGIANTEKALKELLKSFNEKDHGILMDKAKFPAKYAISNTAKVKALEVGFNL